MRAFVVIGFAAVLGGGSASGLDEGESPAAPPAGAPAPRASPKPTTVQGHRNVFLVDPADRRVSGNVVLDYDGKYSDDPRWERRVAAVVEAVPQAAEFVRDRLGLGDRPQPRFLVRFQDTGDRNPETFMTTYSEIHGRELRQCIVIQSESLMSEEHDLVFALRHEIAHCWQMSGLQEAFWELPGWVKEGLAVWVSGEGPNRVRAACIETAFAPEADPEKAILGGLAGPRSHDRYAEYYLAYAMVEEINGLPAVRSLVQELLRSSDYRSALQRATGAAYPDFVSRALPWARARVQRSLAGRGRLLGARRPFLEGKFSEARTLYEAFLESAEENVFQPLAVAELGFCEMRLGNLEKARSHFHSARGSEPRCYLNKMLDYCDIRVTEKAGDFPAVVGMCRRYLKDHISASPETKLRVQKILEKAEGAAGAQGSTGGGK